MRKKKILIFSHALELGGAERSLLGLMEAFDKEKYDVDLFLMRHEGELMSYIPEGIHLLPEASKYTVLARPMKNTLKEGHFLLTACRLHAKYAAKKFNKKNRLVKSEVSLEYSHKYIKKWMPEISPMTVYDLAISFLTPHYFVAEKVCAKKKVAWIHTDYSSINIDINSELRMWDQFDHIISISDAVTEGFIKIFPTLKNKIKMIENILPESTIRYQMNQSTNLEIRMNVGAIKLLSIGRFCDAKNFDSVPKILNEIRKSGKDIHWYLIGYGPDQQLIEDRIFKEGMQEYVHIIGKTDNPYPYIKACDIYVQPSRYEGRCVSVKEAQLLHKPVIITRYSTSSSQLEEGIDGWIVEMNPEKCAQGIVELINNKEKLKYVAENCKTRDYTNRKEIQKLYELMEQ